MHTKNHIIFLYTLLIIFIASVIFTSYSFDRYIDNINDRIDVMDASTSILLSNMEMMQEQLNTIEQQNIKIEEPTHDLENDDQELRILSQLIEAESGTQSFEGKLAVGTVVMNRVESGIFPNNIKDVVFQKNQFSVVQDGKIHNDPSDESIMAAQMVLEGTRVLNPKVLYFYNPKIVRTGNWIRGRQTTKVIGDHAFAF